MSEAEQVISGVPDSIAVATELLDRQWRELSIYTPVVTTALYNNSELLNGIRQRLLRQSRARCRLLLPPVVAWRRDCPHLVALIQRFSTVELRIVADHETHEKPEFSQGFVITDGRELLHHIDPKRCQGKYYSTGSIRARELSGFFTMLWEHSLPSFELRQLPL